MFYFDIYRSITSNATPNTEDNVLALRTVANQKTAYVKEQYVSGRLNTPGGIVLRLKTTGTIGTGGSAVTPAKRDPETAAAGTTAFDATFTDGATPTIRHIVGVAAQGGFGGWIAGELESAIKMLPNGGANGNFELHNVAAVASAPFESNTVICE